jgi:hypothetical protein
MRSHAQQPRLRFAATAIFFWMMETEKSPIYIRAGIPKLSKGNIRNANQLITLQKSLGDRCLIGNND